MLWTGRSCRRRQCWLWRNRKRATGTASAPKLRQSRFNCNRQLVQRVGREPPAAVDHIHRDRPEPVHGWHLALGERLRVRAGPVQLLAFAVEQGGWVNGVVRQVGRPTIRGHGRTLQIVGAIAALTLHQIKRLAIACSRGSLSFKYNFQLH